MEQPLGVWTLRLMKQKDLSEIIEVHSSSFPGFFLTFLGRDFLRLLYEGIGGDPDGIVFVADRDGHVDGFVAGVLHQSGFYRRLIGKRKWKFALAAIGAVLRRPTIAPRLLRALDQPVQVRKYSCEACLMSVAVRPEANGKGIGQSLVQEFCSTLTQKKVPAVSLTTDRDNNERTNRFYLQLGFHFAQTFVTPEGRRMNEYVKTLEEG